MNQTKITIYYSIIALILFVQTVYTVLSGGSVVLNSATVSQLKQQQQALQQQRQLHIAELTKHTALSALPIGATDGYTAITHPIVVAHTETLASN